MHPSFIIIFITCLVCEPALSQAKGTPTAIHLVSPLSCTPFALSLQPGWDGGVRSGRFVPGRRSPGWSSAPAENSLLPQACWGKPSALRYSLRADFFCHNLSSPSLLKCKMGKRSGGRKSGELETCGDSSLEAPCLLMRHETPCGFCNAELTNGLSWTACLPAENEVATVN